MTLTPSRSDGFHTGTQNPPFLGERRVQNKQQCRNNRQNAHLAVDQKHARDQRGALVMVTTKHQRYSQPVCWAVICVDSSRITSLRLGLKRKHQNETGSRTARVLKTKPF